MSAAFSRRKEAALSDIKNGGYVSNATLAAELRSVRWEVRCLIAIQTILVLGLVKAGVLPGTDLPGPDEAIGLISHLF